MYFSVTFDDAGNVGNTSDAYGFPSEGQQYNNQTSDDLVNGYSVSESQPLNKNQSSDSNTVKNDDEPVNNPPKIQWYQYGKDGNCYLMGVDNGVTDVISAMPAKQCK